jgi:GNAT superfamily N-acetyltransferase
MNYQIRKLTVADAVAYRQVRLAALRLHPEAFSAAYEDETTLTMAQVVERLTMPSVTVFGAFAETGDLVGLAGLRLNRGAKVHHKAGLFSMFVDAAHRGSGVSRRLVEAVIAGARDAGAVVLHLFVTAGNAPAQRMYQQMGFTVYGFERRALKVGERFCDQELMALDLDGGPPPG